MIPDWSGDTVCVVASGPSAPDIVDAVRGRMRVVVINRGYELAPWADSLYAADSGFWMYYSDARKFAGLKFAPDAQCQRYCLDIKLVSILKEQGRRVDRMIYQPVGTIGGGGHSGFQALNLAVQTGARRVYLAGYDYLDRHWHPDHPALLRNPEAVTLKTWRNALDAQAPSLVAHGIEVINLSPVSTLRNFRREESRAFSQGFATLSA